MRVLNIGSLNLDHVYNVDHIITPGETEATGGLNLYLGGKGINQSIALESVGKLDSGMEYLCEPDIHPTHIDENS